MRFAYLQWRIKDWLGRQIPDLSRPVCDLFGCTLNEQGCACERCGADYYWSFYDFGRLEPILSRYWAFKLWLRELLVGRKCEVCGKRISAFKGRHAFTCSDKCADEWIPF